MSQNYEFRSLEYVDEDNQDNQSEALTVFETGDTKTIDFVKKDGTRQSFPYGHYMTAWYEKKKDTNEWAIKIFFATHLVTISGFGLEKIYDELRQFHLKSLIAHDIRYADDIEDSEPFVSGILIEWKNKEE